MAAAGPTREKPEIAHISATVRGHVQGVFFRYFVCNAARDLGLRGYVRNLEGGDAVEVEAEGEKPQLLGLLEQLKVGPPRARVDSVDEVWSDCSGQFSDFVIRH